ncbi:GAF domain-containing protein [Flavobacterium sp. xlx-214]|uniref:GAF domain-containing protein n=1 Tax=unclassified Flavobacterium TaxID=196869 RepID=UPI0013D0F594|nr:MULTISPECIES: GAF domain-containing protein [unclassified Flavobacterium]MBA5791851.1 GAF domain-containing protein [Flavobacterium sp. xlx-221]QMI83088.1 GAF domain-containing protein [Flavobacterium sp. xlx-214]
MDKELNLNIDQFTVSPFFSVISFHKVVDSLKEITKEKDAPYRAVYAQSLIEEVNKVPELYTGVTSKKTIYQNLDLIHNLLADLFPTALTYNEIKAVSLPFQNFNFNFTKRFQQIINDAGEEFEINIRDFTNDQYYIFSCCLILNTHYGENFDLTRPLFYDIPDKNGVNRHYRIVYNGDFCELIPTENAVTITKEDIQLLKNSFDDVEIWKQKFPNHSWILKGFGILTLFDVTIENTISNIKTNLLKAGQENMSVSIAQDIFKSIFKIKDIGFGVFFVNNDSRTFIDLPAKVEFPSVFNLYNKKVSKEVIGAATQFFKELDQKEEYYCVTDIKQLYHHKEWIPYLDYLQSRNIQSFILAPIRKNDGFQAYIELYSATPYALHTINANKLNDVMPLLNDTFERYHNDVKNEIDAIIQREYTTIHPSVNWKFEEEAQKLFYAKNVKDQNVLKQIEFEGIFPLYGETDIQGSSGFRNKAMLADLKKQLKEILNILEFVKPFEEELLFDQRIHEVIYFQNQLKKNQFVAEAQINRYIVDNFHPLIKKLSEKEQYKKIIQKYKEQIDPKTERFLNQRKKYDIAIQSINKNLSDIIDEEQAIIQKVYPHYFDRFRTDGIEHNLFIGASIAPKQVFDVIYLYNLRLWQIQVMCKMVVSHQRVKEKLSFDMQLTSLIIVYNEAVSIKFRMDEKRFDVEGNNDIRYEILKKRLAKATIKDSTERLVQANKLVIVYLNDLEKTEYLNYIQYLQIQNYFTSEIEEITIEDLQDITNLKALRLTINTTFDLAHFKFFSYSDYIKYYTTT